MGSLTNLISVGLFTLSCLQCMAFAQRSSDEESWFQIDFPPTKDNVPLHVRQDYTTEIWMNFTALKPISNGISVQFVSGDKDTFRIINQTSVFPSTLDLNESFPLFVGVKGVFIGHSDLKFISKDKSGKELYKGSTKFDVFRSKQGDKLSKAFTGVMIVVVCVNNFLMGTQLDLKVIRECVKKPVGPAIGFACQFILMPLISFGWGWAMLSEWPILQLSYFAAGCSPGGGSSNFWTILLDGNIDLSVTMTFFSNICAFFMMPIWLFSLTRTFYPDIVSIPFINIFGSLVGLIIPSCLGLAFITWKPQLVLKFRKAVKCFSLFILAIVVCFGLYANYFIFLLMRWYTIIAGFLLPWTGYALAYGVAFLLKQDYRNRITIAVETGIQNGGICIVLLTFSLREPDRDLSLVMPICVMLFTSAPLWAFLLFRFIRRRYFGQDEEEKDKEEKNKQAETPKPKLETSDGVSFSNIQNGQTNNHAYVNQAMDHRDEM